MSLKPLQLPHKLWAIIPAAGSGSRFSKTELKQYQMIGQKTVLEHTVLCLNQLPLQGYVLVIGSDDDVAQSLPFTNMEKAHFCEGGAERVDSVLNALNYLSTIADADDWVFVHDAARPCVTRDCLLKLIGTAIQSNTGAILAIPVRDTLKRVISAQDIQETVDRSQLWQAQTPQIAKLGVLKKAIEHALEAQALITDEASALEFVGEKVQVYKGAPIILKLPIQMTLSLHA